MESFPPLLSLSSVILSQKIRFETGMSYGFSVVLKHTDREEDENDIINDLCLSYRVLCLWYCKPLSPENHRAVHSTPAESSTNHSPHHIAWLPVLPQQNTHTPTPQRPKSKPKPKSKLLQQEFSTSGQIPHSSLKHAASAPSTPRSHLTLACLSPSLKPWVWEPPSLPTAGLEYSS